MLLLQLVAGNWLAPATIPRQAPTHPPRRTARGADWQPKLLLQQPALKLVAFVAFAVVAVAITFAVVVVIVVVVISHLFG